MRSRYSAFVLKNAAYLLSTWHPAHRPPTLTFEARQKWLGLKIIGAEAGGPLDTHGTVEFIARFRIDGQGHRLHEVSRFERISGRWYYEQGQVKVPGV